MTGRLRAWLRGADDGITLIETSVSMVVGVIVITAMIGFVIGTSKTDDLHQADDMAVQDLRISRELLSRDLRSAEAVTRAESHRITLWLDTDRDDDQESGELVTWIIDAELGLTRQTDTGIPVPHARTVIAGESSFAYDSTTPSEITEVRFVLVSAVDSATVSGERSVQTTIHLRNGGSS